MAEYETVRRAGTGTRVGVIDEGLREHMNRVYGLMAAAMVITGLVAWIVGTDFARAVAGEPTVLIPAGLLATMYTSPVRWIIMFAPLIFVFGFAAGINRMAVSTAQTVFWAFAAVMGLSIAWIFAVFTGMSIAQVFFTTAIAFAALSLYGYTTQRDLSGWGTFLIMGVIGLIVAMVINLFIGSPALHFAVTVIGLLIFAGLTAYDTQRLKNEYLMMRGTDGEAYLGKAAILGALSLYINFINMFMFLLQFLGQRE